MELLGRQRILSKLESVFTALESADFILHIQYRVSLIRIPGDLELVIFN